MSLLFFLLSMLCLLRRERPRQVLPLIALLAWLSSGVGRAQTIDYAADLMLAGTNVNLGSHGSRPVSLAEIFSIVESETPLKFKYSDGQFPLGAEVVLESEGVMSLAKLFGIVSAQNDIVFEHRGGEIIVRSRRREEASAPGRGETRIEASPRPVSAEATDGLAAEVGGIAGDSNLSRTKKEKLISAAVRAHVVALAAGTDDNAEILARAMEAVSAAASEVPQFVEAIANAASFAPPVAGIKSGASQVRAAAYGGSRGARKRSGIATKTGAAVPTGSRTVVKVPAIRAREILMGSAAAAPDTPAPVDKSSGGVDVSSQETRVQRAAPAAAAPAEPAVSAPATSPTTPAMPPISVSPINIPSGSASSAVRSETPDASGVVRMEQFGVQASTTRGSTNDLRAERVKAAVAIDFLSSTQLAKYGASDLSDVVFRIPGVSVAGGQFAVVRGLSDRFLSTTLQGIKLPTPDPEKQAVQLDLIPASAVEAVVVSKTYESSLWAESSGGNMDVRTRAIPTEGLLKLSVGFKVNSNAADGGPDYSIRGATNERLGFGSKSRLEFGKADPTWQYVPAHRRNFPVGNKLSVEYAHAFTVGEGQLGVLANAFSEASYKSRTGVKQSYQAKGGAPATPAKAASGNTPAVAANPGRPSDFETRHPSGPSGVDDYEQSETENVLGLTTSVGYRLSANHEIKFTGIFVQSGIDLAQVAGAALATDPVTNLPKAIAPRDYNSVTPNTYALLRTNEYFRERNLTVLQLSGRHTLPVLGDLKLNWSAQRGTSYEKQSPSVEANYATPLNNLNKSFVAFGGSDVPLALKAIWADNHEKQKAARLDFDWPFRLWGQQVSNLTFGGAFESTDRETSGITIDYALNNSGTGIASTPNGVFSSIVGGQTGIATPPTTAARETRAYFAGVNLAVLETLKLVAGARRENFSLTTTGSGRWGGSLTSAQFYGNNPAKGILGTVATNNPSFESQAWYPSAGLIYTPWKSLTARLHYSKTAGRPSLREVSPFFNKSIETDNLVVGNPALKPSDVTNYDVRIEWSPTKTDFFALSAFRKDIERPIEKLIFNQTNAAVGENTESWVNNPNRALVKGLEFEFRHQLKSWSESLQDFSLSGNYTRIEATVGEIPQVLANMLGSFQDPNKIPRTRRLFDQPEYIANLDLTWSHSSWGTSATVAVFALSDVLAGTGKPFAFDLYERANTRVDFLFNQQISARLKLKLAIKNLADPARGLIYDREATSMLAERNTYHAGRDYNGSLTYDF